MNWTTRNRSSLELILVTAVCAYLFFYGLGNFGLVGADEPRYAQVAREMLERDDYVTPILYGQPWLEKPALYYWRAMFAFETFGIHDWAARLPSASFALGMVVIIFFHMRRFRPGAELDAALITASCAGIIGFARGASTDMQLAGPFTVAMLGWYAWYETGKKIWLVDLYVFLAIGTLAKGPVAPVLAGLVVLIFCFMRRDIKAAFRTLWIPGILIYLAIALPWFVAVQSRNPQFLTVFILQHNLARFSSDAFRHMQPFWFYLPVLLLSLVPWTFFAMPALVDAFRSCLQDWRTPNAAKAERANFDSFPEFLVIWAIIPILFFSISQSKLPGYILPAIAPCTILTADYLARRRELAMSTIVVAAHSALIAVIVGLFLMFPYMLPSSAPMSMNSRYVVGLVAMMFFIGSFYTLRKRGVELLRFVTLLPVVLIIGFILRVAAPNIDGFYSARPIAVQLDRLGTAGRTTAAYKAKREVRYGLSFYRNQRVNDYTANEIPPSEHLLVARAGTRAEFEPLVEGRRVTLLGNFPAQRLEFFWVAERPSEPVTAKTQPSAAATRKPQAR